MLLVRDNGLFFIEAGDELEARVGDYISHNLKEHGVLYGDMIRISRIIKFKDKLHAELVNQPTTKLGLNPLCFKKLSEVLNNESL